MSLVNGSRPSGYSIRCKGTTTRYGKESCGVQDLTRDEYMRQLSDADTVWVCPRCGGPGWIIEPETEDEDHDFV